MSTSASLQPQYVLCDTSVVSLLQAAASKPELIAHWPTPVRATLDNSVLAITLFTLGEAKSGYRRANWGQHRIDQFELALANYLLLPVDFDVLNRYVEIRAKYHKQIGDNDMWIAATAQAKGWPLATCDLDFCLLRNELNLLYVPRNPNSPPSCP